MKVLYYYYYLFYTKVLPDDEPHATTIFTLSVSEGFLINGILQISFAHFFCISIDKWPMIGILILLIIANYFHFHLSGKNKEIIKLKPKVLNSNKLSILMVVCFFLITFSFLLLGAFYVKEILEHCR